MRENKRGRERGRESRVMIAPFHHCEAVILLCDAWTQTLDSEQDRTGTLLGEPSPGPLKSFLMFTFAFLCLTIIGPAEWVLLKSPKVHLNCLDSKEAESSEIIVLKFLVVFDLFESEICKTVGESRK